MQKLKLFYIFSVFAALFLLSLIVYNLTYQAAPGEFKTTTQHGLLEFGDYSIAYVIISNNEGRDVNYTISTSIDRSGFFNQPVRVRDGRKFSHVRYVYAKKGEKKEVVILVYKDDLPEPIENITYHVGGVMSEEEVQLLLDSDADGARDHVDNCPSTYNPEQKDTDGDGIGDACDEDDDNDSIQDAKDACPLVSASADANQDGCTDHIDDFLRVIENLSLPQSLKSRIENATELLNEGSDSAAAEQLWIFIREVQASPEISKDTAAMLAQYAKNSLANM